jgi:Uma2 family endonuclease
MGDPQRKATYEDVLAAPAGKVAEVIDGRLLLHPRPALPHAAAASALGEELGPPFKRGRNGPGGWILLDEPELHLGEDILVPDLAGWRRERLPALPADPYLTLAPDWLCEVLSPRTAKIDRADKLPVYARESVRHVWLLDPLQHTLETLRLDGEHYTLLGVHTDDAVVNAEPFEVFDLHLSVLWADVQPPARP